MRNTILIKYGFPLVLIIVIAGSFAIIPACGGGGGSSSPGSAPVISSLSWVPQSAIHMEGGGSVDVKFDLLYRDSDGDIKTLRVTDSDGGDFSEDISATMGGSTSGLLTFYIPADTSIIGTFTFQIWLIDSRGNASNHLSGSFTVSPPSLPMKGTSGNAVNMNGTWTQCKFYAASHQDELQKVTLSGNSATVTLSIWDASTTAYCLQTATPDALFKVTATAALGAEATATWTDGAGSTSPPSGVPAGAKATMANVTLNSATLTLISPAYVNDFNTRAACGKTDWAVNVAKDVSSCPDIFTFKSTDYWVVDDSAVILRWYMQDEFASAAYEVDSINPLMK
jgi:hypothetical protein